MQSTVTSDILLSIVSAILFLVSIFSNLIVIIHALRREVFKDTCQSRIIILNTAVVDLFGSFDCLASAFGYYSHTFFTENDVICEIEALRQGFFKSQAHNALLLLAMNRFYMFVKPGKANQEFSKFMATSFIICTWLYSLWLLIFVRLSDHPAVYSHRFGACILEIDPITGLCLFTVRLLVIFGIVYCYARALYSFRKRRKALAANIVKLRGVKVQQPVKITELAETVERVEPVKPADPIEPVVLVEPVPGESEVPVEIMEPKEPADTIDIMEHVELELGESLEQVETAEPMEPGDTTEPTERVELKLVEPVEREKAEQVKRGEHVETVEPAEIAESVERTKPVKRTNTTEQTEQMELKPVEPVKPVGRTEPIKLTESPEQADQISKPVAQNVISGNSTERIPEAKVQIKSEDGSSSTANYVNMRQEITLHTRGTKCLDLRRSNASASLPFSLTRNRRKKTLTRVSFYPLWKLY